MLRIACHNAYSEFATTVLGKVIVLLPLAPCERYYMLLSNSVSETKSWISNGLFFISILYMSMFIVTVCFLFLKPSLYYHGLKILLLTSILALSAHAYFLRPSLHPRLTLSGFSLPSKPFPIRCGDCSFTSRCTRPCNERVYFPEKTTARQSWLGVVSLTQTILLMNAFEQFRVLLINTEL